MSGHHALTLTTHRRLGAGEVLRRGSLRPYRRVAAVAGELHRLRGDLIGEPAAAGFAVGEFPRSLFTLAHVTDLQLADVESTVRFEFFNRESADPLFAKLVPVQRPQETLAARAMQAMVDTLNRLHSCAGTPVSGSGLDLVVTTGDAIDNAQWNELRNWLALLDGGPVRPASGGGGYAGVQAREWPDDIFWRPDGGADIWRSHYGFGSHPGLVRQALAEFEAPGLDVGWLACYGNHEALIQGVGVVTPELAELMVAGRKPSRLRPGLGRAEALETFRTAGQRFFGPGDGSFAVAADAGRRPVNRAEFVEAHFGGSARPGGHGFGDRNRRDGTAYYSYDAVSQTSEYAVRFIALDTNSLVGGADGCLDEDQLRWLETELVAVHRNYLRPDGSSVATGNADRLVVLFSHHGSATLTNARGARVDGTEARAVGAADIEALLHRFPNVVLWLNGHTHTNAVRAHPSPHFPGQGFWEVTTCAIMDWPCQARIVELLDAGDGFLALACTMLDHHGGLDPDGRVVSAEGPLYSVTDLAGLHRELAGNVPWADFDSPTSGTSLDRNVVLAMRAPFPPA